MYSILNCTPHPIALSAEMFDGEVLDARGMKPASAKRGGTEVLIFEPSGFRFPGHSRISYGPIGCHVEFTLDESSKDEVSSVTRIFAQNMGVTMIVVASEISVRVLNGALFDAAGGTPIRAMWPVLDERALRLPPDQRWCKALAVPYKRIVNDVDEDVGLEPAY